MIQVVTHAMLSKSLKRPAGWAPSECEGMMILPPKLTSTDADPEIEVWHCKECGKVLSINPSGKILLNEYGGV